ncbi:MAG: hypothetical protein KC620_21640, partial [Myxococcales bacterium]|nr:hypothetical protein [Myxococcales bacterium]
MRNPYLTRLYTTMSPSEMSADPIFEFNRDLEDVDSLRRATRYIGCSGDVTIETPVGARYNGTNASNPDAIVRQNGETVRGDGPAALRIERVMAAGQPETIVDNTALILARYNTPLPSGFDDGGAEGEGE